MDGTNSVQRYLLPGLTHNISFPVPVDPLLGAQQAVAVQATPISPHTVALVAGHVGWSPPGNGVHVFDDAVQRAAHTPSFLSSGEEIDWLQWGSDDSLLYGSTIEGGEIATMPVNSAGVTLTSTGGGVVRPTISQYDRGNGMLYSYGGAYDPVKLTLSGSFDLPITSAEACTADSSVNRYYCVTTYYVDGTDVTAFELWVFDLTSYALVDRVYFGVTAGSPLSPITGAPYRLVRWGKAGLALISFTETYKGNGGVFLIDGAAVNPKSTPDVSSGTAPVSYAWMNSISPQSAPASSGNVTVTIKGQGFSPNSTACWNCSFIQERFLPTTYVSSTELSVLLPVSELPTSEPLQISVLDAGSNLFSSNALTFTVQPAQSGTTQVTPVNLCGLGMAWDQSTQLLYVGAADYDGAYPNSVVAVNATDGSIAKTQVVGPF